MDTKTEEFKRFARSHKNADALVDKIERELALKAGALSVDAEEDPETGAVTIVFVAKTSPTEEPYLKNQLFETVAKYNQTLTNGFTFACFVQA